MPAIENVGKAFTSGGELVAYLQGISYASWKPKFITMHHTGSPSLATWNMWQDRGHPSDWQWLKNLASFYGSPPPVGPPDGPWSSGPHFFFTPSHYLVLTPPNKKGIHAKSFNALAWGVECVGDFDSEKSNPKLLDWYSAGIAALHMAMDFSPAPFSLKSHGLHFHRDDPLTSKSCPGHNISKSVMIDLIEKYLFKDEKEAPDRPPAVVTKGVKPLQGVVVTPGDTLNLRVEPSGKSAPIAELEDGRALTIKGEAGSGEAKWLLVDVPSLKLSGWVSARYVDITPGA